MCAGHDAQQPWPPYSLQRSAALYVHHMVYSNRSGSSTEPHLPVAGILKVSVIPSAGALVIKALKEPTRDRKKVGRPPTSCCSNDEQVNEHTVRSHWPEYFDMG
jgi:hypothetical protein